MDNFEKLLGNSYRFLSFRPRSEKEVRDYLRKKLSKAKSASGGKDDESIINSVIDKLNEHKFLDDVEFAKWWIEQRSKIKPKALKFIKFELKQKGINQELIEEVLEDKDFVVESDFDKAINLAEKRMGRYKNEEKQKKYEKMVRFLASKGFDYDTIKKVIDHAISKHNITHREWNSD